MINKIVSFEEPFLKLEHWLNLAKKSYDKLKLNNHNAAILSTVSELNQPSSRVILIKEVNKNGLAFFTNLHSKKSQQITNNSRVSLLFFWESLHKQIRIEGHVVLINDIEADKYFNSRPYLSKIGAWASKQSQVMENRSVLRNRIVKFLVKYNLLVPRPAFWSGYRVIPNYFEFWEEGKFRLHKRMVYNKTTEGFKVSLLFP